MPKLGETVKGNGFEKSFGGKGANQAVQCARLGVSTAFVGAVGNDVYGSDYKNSLTNETINVQHLQIIDNCNSGIATIWVEATGKNSIIIIPGANLKFDDSQLENTLSSVKSAKVAMFQNEIAEKVTEQGLRLVKELGILSIFNPAPVSEYCNQIVGLCDILCVNEVELSVLANLPVSNENEIYTACRKLLQGGCQSVIATLGEQGAVLVTQDEQVVFAAPKVKAVDSVGAGDSFLGKFSASNIDAMFEEKKWTMSNRLLGCTTCTRFGHSRSYSASH